MQDRKGLIELKGCIEEYDSGAVDVGTVYAGGHMFTTMPQYILTGMLCEDDVDSRLVPGNVKKHDYYKEFYVGPQRAAPGTSHKEVAEIGGAKTAQDDSSSIITITLTITLTLTTNHNP